MLNFDCISTIITDLDGTLVELKIEYEKARRESITMLMRMYPFPRDFFSNTDTISQLYEKSLNILKNKEHATVVKEITNKLTKIANKYELDAAKKNKSFSGSHIFTKKN